MFKKLKEIIKRSIRDEYEDFRYFKGKKFRLDDPFIFKTKARFHKISKVNVDVYYPKTNIGENVEIEYGSYWLDLISEDEYNKLNKSICDCAYGEGHYIKRKEVPYSGDEISTYINEKYPKYTVEYWECIDKNDGRFYIDGIKTNISLSNRDYYKKACLNCGKCLDEIREIELLFVKEFDKIEEDKIVDKICGGE